MCCVSVCCCSAQRFTALRIDRRRAGVRPSFTLAPFTARFLPLSSTAGSFLTRALVSRTTCSTISVSEEEGGLLWQGLNATRSHSADARYLYTIFLSLRRGDQLSRVVSVSRGR